MFNPDQNTSDQQQYFQANSASQIDTGEIRTVFVSGLPDDVCLFLSSLGQFLIFLGQRKRNPQPISIPTWV